MRVSKRLENKSQMKRKNTRRLIIESDSDMSDSQSDSDFNCDENEISESDEYATMGFCAFHISEEKMEKAIMKDMKDMMPF